MNDLQVFKNEDFGEIRTLLINGELWFVGKDVAERLGYSKAQNAISIHVDMEDTLKQGILSNGGVQETILINESGLYSLVLSSKLPSARKFKHWITSEVIPSVRKHGTYMTMETIKETLTNPDFIIKLATELKKEQNARKFLENKIETDKPKVLFANSVNSSNTSILIREQAKLLTQNGYTIGGNELFSWMRRNGYLINSKTSDYNLPTQYAMNLELFEIKETAITHNSGTVTISRTPKVTGKGQIYFINKFLKNKKYNEQLIMEDI